jgi:hypothetical protein
VRSTVSLIKNRAKSSGLIAGMAAFLPNQSRNVRRSRAYAARVCAERPSTACWRANPVIAASRFIGPPPPPCMTSSIE